MIVCLISLMFGFVLSHWKLLFALRWNASFRWKQNWAVTPRSVLSFLLGLFTYDFHAYFCRGYDLRRL